MSRLNLKKYFADATLTLKSDDQGEQPASSDCRLSARFRGSKESFPLLSCRPAPETLSACELQPGARLVNGEAGQEGEHLDGRSILDLLHMSGERMHGLQQRGSCSRPCRI